MSEIMTGKLQKSYSWHKQCTVDPKPEPNVQKKFFSIIFDHHFLGFVQNDVFLENILRGFFADSCSPVHGESNDTLFASNQSKLVEKLSSAGTYDRPNKNRQ